MYRQHVALCRLAGRPKLCRATPPGFLARVGKLISRRPWPLSSACYPVGREALSPCVCRALSACSTHTPTLLLPVTPHWPKSAQGLKEKFSSTRLFKVLSVCLSRVKIEVWDCRVEIGSVFSDLALRAIWSGQGAGSECGRSFRRR
jgi:hypothetical protein